MTLAFKFFLCCLTYTLGLALLMTWGGIQSLAGVIYGGGGMFVLACFGAGGLYNAIFGGRR
jgi:hypothetical protein